MLINQVYNTWNVFCFLLGLVPRVVKVAPACAIMISSYEYFKNYFKARNREQRLGISEASIEWNKIRCDFVQVEAWVFWSISTLCCATLWFGYNSSNNLLSCKGFFYSVNVSSDFRFIFYHRNAYICNVIISDWVFIYLFMRVFSS